MRTIPMAPINYLEEKDRLKELMEANEEWRLMKVIVLGNGRIGKTTFIHFLHKLLAPETVLLSYKRKFVVLTFISETEQTRG